MPKLNDSASSTVAILRNAMLSRAIDDFEAEMFANGQRLPHAFSAAGHEVVQSLIGHYINHSNDGVFSYYRSKSLWLSVGLELQSYVSSALQIPGSYGNGRNVAVLPYRLEADAPKIAPVFGGVGSQFEPALGWARSLKMKGRPKGGGNAFVFAGDGAVATGGFWSAIRESATHQLPIVIVIENNGLALSTPSHQQFKGDSIARQLESLDGIQSFFFDGSINSKFDEVDELIKSARTGGEPILLEFSVSRLGDHSLAEQRAIEEETELPTDPISDLKQHCIASKFTSPDEITEMEQEISANVRSAFESTRSDKATQYLPVAIPTNSTPRRVSREIELEHQFGANKVSLGHAINCWLRNAMAHDPKIVLMGEDIGGFGGAHGITRGLQGQFGTDRVVDASLNEGCILGQALGMALGGLRPIVEIQYRKYLEPAIEQFSNIGWCEWLTSGKLRLPVIVRLPFGRAGLNDPWHSESNEAQVLRAVGFDVVCPTTAMDGINAFESAYQSAKPTVILEHRDLYYSSPSRQSIENLSRDFTSFGAKVLREGSDLSVVTWGRSVADVLKVANAEQSIGIEVIDLGWLKPWDVETVSASVSKTNRCLIVHEDRQFMGFGAEISAELSKRCFSSLKAPVERLGASENPVPIAPTLVKESLPNVDSIRSKIESMLR